MKIKISPITIRKELRGVAPKRSRVSRSADFKIKKANSIEHPSLCATGTVFDVATA